MKETYKELVVEGSYQLVRGYLTGYLEGSGIDADIYYNRKELIRIEMKTIWGRILRVQKNGTPWRNPRNSGGSPRGVSEPPILLTRKMKKTMI